MRNGNIFKEYWHLWAIVILLPSTLYWFIKLPWCFDAIGGKDAPKEWLGFLGGYLGAIISASVAFIILSKQIKVSKKESAYNRKDNETQNEANRIANEAQNEKNRQLQLKTIEYQQNMQWFNDFKKMAAEYVIIINNNLVVAQNNLRDNPNKSYEITRGVLDNLQMAKIVYRQQNVYQ